MKDVIETTYFIGGVRVNAFADNFMDILAGAKHKKADVRCGCVPLSPASPEMTVVQLGETYFLRRLSNTGPEHHETCKHFGDSAATHPQASLRDAVKTDRDGCKTLRLDSPMSVKDAEDLFDGADLGAPETHRTETPTTRRLTMWQLLLLLLEESELNVWLPGFRGKRTPYGVYMRLREAIKKFKQPRNPNFADSVFIVPAREGVGNWDTRAEITEFIAKHAPQRRGVKKAALLIGEYADLAVCPTTGSYRLSLKWLHRHYVFLTAKQGAALQAKLDRYLPNLAQLEHRFLVICRVTVQGRSMQFLDLKGVVTDERYLVYENRDAQAMLIDYLDDHDRQFSNHVPYYKNETVLGAQLLDCGEPIPIFHAGDIGCVPPGVYEDTDQIPALNDLKVEGKVVIWDWENPTAVKLPPPMCTRYASWG